MISSAIAGSSGRRTSASVGICKKPTGTAPQRAADPTRRAPLCAPPWMMPMTRAERTANLIGVVVPFAGVLAAIVLLWNSWVDATDLAIFAVGYAICGFGIT